MSCVTRNTSTNCYFSYSILLKNYNKTQCLVEEKKDSEFVPFSKNEISTTRIETKIYIDAILLSYRLWFCEDDKVKIKQLDNQAKINSFQSNFSILSVVLIVYSFN